MDGRAWLSLLGGGALLGHAAYLVSPQWWEPVAGVALVFLSQIDRFHEFSFGKDGLKIIRKAQDTLVEMRKLALTLAEMELWSQQALGRFGGGGRKAKDEYRGRIEDLLKELGATDEQIAEAIEPAAKFTDFDYFRAIFERHDITKKHPGWDTIMELQKHGFGDLPSPQRVRSALESCGAMDDVFSEAIDDYEHWLKSRRHRRGGALT